MPDESNDALRREQPARDEDQRPRDRDRGAADTGHTAGGGSLGHEQPEKVTRETPTRNTDPVMPADDSTLNTKI